MISAKNMQVILDALTMEWIALAPQPAKSLENYASAGHLRVAAMSFGDWINERGASRPIGGGWHAQDRRV
jgi:hypothetical protein